MKKCNPIITIECEEMSSMEARWVKKLVYRVQEEFDETWLSMRTRHSTHRVRVLEATVEGVPD